MQSINNVTFMRTYNRNLTMQEQLNSHPYRGSDLWTEDKSIRGVIIVKRDIAAALSSSTVCLCPSALCRVHNYTHTYTLEMGYINGQATFSAIQFIYRCCHDNQSFILQIPGSCPWWEIVITPPRDTPKPPNTLMSTLQHQNAFFW